MSMSERERERGRGREGEKVKGREGEYKPIIKSTNQYQSLSNTSMKFGKALGCNDESKCEGKVRGRGEDGGGVNLRPKIQDR